MPNLLDLYEAIKPKYLIFCDMDGVLVDFDKGYEELTGKSTKHHDVQDKNDFWRLLDKSLEEKGLEEYYEYAATGNFRVNWQLALPKIDSAYGLATDSFTTFGHNIPKL